jgi:hypothetical protein
VFAMQAGDKAKGVWVPHLLPPRTRSPEPTIVGEALADDAWTASPLWETVESWAVSLPAADARVESPLHAIEAGGVTSAGDVRATTPPGVIDVDPISARPAGTEDLIRDQLQNDQAPGGPGTTSAQVPPSSSSSPRFPRREINWNHTPW